MIPERLSDPVAYLCFSFSNADVAFVVVIVAHASDQLAGFMRKVPGKTRSTFVIPMR